MTTTSLHLWTVDDYHRMIEAEIITTVAFPEVEVRVKELFT
ncbi:hypothetical protein QUB80_12060 [Chlorogloeopsis sp. ULAP01]|nr:hypothetical protein [Chlorogloeopsis sp. ULAP01]MDM9381435.1 hypothetical protein [Chlorogloeopsis sp. ULAP01]